MRGGSGERPGAGPLMKPHCREDHGSERPGAGSMK